MAQWQIDDIPWQTFRPERVVPAILPVIKAASMVEYQSADYATYLCSVFNGDEEFCAAARHWEEEEIQHGRALGRWAELADPDFDFPATFARYREAHTLPLDAVHSVRGSRTGELIARCVVEAGTSSYYSALRDAVDEPVLKSICRHIAGDEYRHFKLFYYHLGRYQARESLSLWRRIWVVFRRFAEGDDDELAFAFHCGTGATTDYDRKAAFRGYCRSVLPLYRYPHVHRGFAMALKAAGIRPPSRVGKWATSLAWWLFRRRVRACAQTENPRRESYEIRSET